MISSMQMADRQEIMQRIVIADRVRQPAEDLAAPLRLRLDELQIVVDRVARRYRSFQLLGNDDDGRQRRSQFVRRSGGETVERMQLLFAGEHELGRRQRVRHLPRFLGKPARVKTHEKQAADHRGPHADAVEGMQVEGLPGIPGQRQIEVGEKAGHHDGQATQQQSADRRQARRRNGDRGDDQEGERIVEAAGQVKQGGELHHVVGEQRRRHRRRQPVAGRKAQPHERVERRGKADDDEAMDNRQIEAEHQVNAKHGDQLADDADPAQPRQCLQAYAAGRLLDAVLGSARAAAEDVPSAVGARRCGSLLCHDDNPIRSTAKRNWPRNGLFRRSV